MLFFGKKKEVAPLDLRWLETDMHSHLLPGIDDGSPDMETSLELIRGLQDLGYKKLITTPHIFWELYPNTFEEINTQLANLQQAVKNEGLGINVQAAAEYYVDEHFENLLNEDKPLLTLSDNKVLIEISMISAPLDLQQVLFTLQVKGYQPVIAHPERYVYLTHRKEVFDELRGAGCLFQLNLLSLTGYYGKPVQELAEYLCKADYYSFAGTDLHHERHLQTLQKLASSATFQRLRDSGILKNAQL